MPGFFQHAVYGLPSHDQMTDFEKLVTQGLLLQINEAFGGLRRLKLSYELRKKMDTDVSGLNSTRSNEP